MRSLLTFLLLMLVFALTAQAQQTSQNYKVLFASDKYNLDEDDHKELDKLIGAAKVSPYYEISLNAHTDFDGSNSYNKRLSANRAASVRKYLVEKGLADDQIHDSWFGENRPVATNNNEQGKQQNRRVEIALKSYAFRNVNELLEATKDNYEQKFVLRDKGAQEITGKHGTKVKIPAGAFVLPDGKPIENTNVEMNLEEFHSLSDAIFNNLSTQSEGKILESGGMMKITASYKGQELRLRDGKAMKVELPSNNIEEGMTVFTGVKNEEGIVEWTDTKKSFDITSKDKKARPSLELNTEELKKYFHELPQKQAYTAYSLDIKLPNIPDVPTRPKAPTVPKKPDPNHVVKGLKKIFTTRAAREKIAERKFASMMNSYNIRYTRYEKSLARYEQAKVNYKDKWQAFEESKKDFYTKVDVLLSQLEEQSVHNKEYYNAKRWNGALSSMINQIDNDEFYQRVPLRWLNNAASGYLPDEVTSTLYQLGRRMEFLTMVKNIDINQVAKIYSYKGKLSFSRFDRRMAKQVTEWDISIRSSYLDRENPIAEKMTGIPTLSNMVTDAGIALAEREAELGIMEPNSLNSLYTASLPQMGYVNCDRFYNTPPAMMTKVKIENPGRARVTICIKSINSVLIPNADRRGTLVANIPKGEEVIIIAMKVDKETGKPMFEKQVVKIDPSAPEYRVDPKPVQIRDMVSALATI